MSSFVKPTAERDGISILDSHFKRLQTLHESNQFGAVVDIQAVLRPFAAQILSDCGEYEPKEENLKFIAKLFGSDISNDDLSFQLGDLLHPLNLLAQKSQNVKLPRELVKLCQTLVSVSSVESIYDLAGFFSPSSLQFSASLH